MIIALPVISFLCFAFLCLCLVGSHVRSDIPQLSLVLWLIIGNVIHGLNSLIWSDNTDIHIPVWCDIVTKVLIAAGLALPACCFCMATHLERLASNRPFVTTKPALRVLMFFDLTICWIVPVIFSLLHLIVQHHRFDIIRDFGCFAAIHSSIPSVLVVWLPPFLFCLTSFIFAGLSLHHSFRLSASRFEEHILNRLNVSASLYLRQVITVLILTILTTAFSIFILFTRSDFQSFANWDALHANFKKIFVLGPSPDLSVARMAWWLVPATSIVYIVLWVVVGEDVRCGIRAIRSGKITLPSFPRPPAFKLPKPHSLLPIHLSKRNNSPNPNPRPVYRPQLVAPVLVSGWDEMLDMDARKSSPTVSASSSASNSPTHAPTKPPRPTLTVASAVLPEQSSLPSDEDKKFAISTLGYLNSPTAQILGLHTPISPPPAYKTYLSEKSQVVLPPDPFAKSPAIIKSVPDDVASTVSSIYDIPWPAPPSNIPDSGSGRLVVPAPAVAPMRRAHSPALSDASFAGSVNRPMTPPNERHPPFCGPSISPISRSERLYGELGVGSSKDSKPCAEVIYMTVVTHETREPRAL
ncbi:STE3-domain-containing protein [Marasmius fiardii PR-910]|nr:STE3-domain-containing protein [Marasmius fiardii PR-910]